MKRKLILLAASAASIVAFATSSCALYNKITGSTATPATVQTAVVPQTLTDLWSLAYDALIDYGPLISGSNTQNGQDVANALFEAAAKGTAATAAGQLITDFGGTALAPFANVVSGAITSGSLNKTATAADILNTVAAVVQNITNANAIAAPLSTGTTSYLDPDNQVRSIADCGLRIADCGLRIADCGI